MNKVEIYYFTGSGNSLYIAREMAKRLDGEMISIASLIGHDRIKTDAEVIGIVFPVYYSVNDGLPLIVIEFAKRLENIQSKYIFAVCNSSAGITPANESLSSLISKQGGKISAFFTLKMPSNLTPVPDKSKQHEILQQCEKKFEHIFATVQERKEMPISVSPVLKIILAPLGALIKSIFIAKMQKQTDSPQLKTFYGLTPLMDKCFSADEKCDGCGICSRVCPVGNIEITNNKPSWQHHCETCLACFHWCPKEAVHCPYSKTRYNHPEVEIRDMLSQRSS